MTRPPDPDDVRALFEEVTAPPGVARWRVAGTSPPVPAPHRVRRRRLLAVAACAVAMAAVVGAVPAAQALLGAPDGGHRGDPGRPPVSSAPPVPSRGPSPSASPGSPAPTRGPAPPARPGPGNTGVPLGTTLRTHRGDLTVTARGAVVDAMLVTGSIIVQAPDVTIRRTRVAPASPVYWVIRQLPQATNLIIEDSELAGGGVHIGVNEESAGLTVRRCAIHHVDTAVSLGGDRATIQDSYLHDVSTGVGAAGGNDTVTIRHNTIVSLPAGEAAIGFADQGRPVTGVTIEDNLLAGGGYAFFAGGGGAPGQRIRFSHNRFSRQVHPKGGRYGPVARWDATAPGNVWADNVWDDTGAPVDP